MGESGMEVTRSQEEYLEALLLLQKEEPVVRVRDLAKFLDVTMPSVTGMMRTLAGKGLVEYRPYGYVLLSEEGRKIAEKTFAKHNHLKEFLTYVLGLPEKQADSSACSIEHSLSAEVSRRLAVFVRFMKQCPRCGDDLLQRFRDYLAGRKTRRRECENCVASCVPSSGEADND